MNGPQRRLRVLAALLAVSIGLTLAAAWFGPRFLDWGKYRAAVEAVASAGLGRPVRIGGPIRLSLLPQATLVADDVTTPDIGDGVGATASQLRLQVALGPLLAGRIEPQDLVLRSPHIRLPWPLTPVAASRLVPPPGLHARVEDGTLQVGGLQVTAIGGELRVDQATGTLSAGGVASVMGRPWHMTGRLARPDADRVATMEVSLDGQGAAVGTGGTLSGQISADGELSGRISGRGPDLSLLLPAPARAWKADGQAKAGSGLLVADALEIEIAGVPARGAVAIRLLPHARLDAALATSRLDLDAWLPALLRGGPTQLPTGIEVSADAAQLAGGTLRHLRTGFELGDSGLALREAEAELPGNAALHLSGRLAGGRFGGEARLAASDMPQTLAWLRPSAPAMIDALPQGAWQEATIAGTVTADAGGVALSHLTGTVNGTPVAGDASLRLGARPTVAAALRLTGPVLDRWSPTLAADLPTRLNALLRQVAGFDADVTIAATAPVWHGTALDQLIVEARCTGGTLEVRRASLTGNGVALGLVGTLTPAGRLSDGRLDVSLRQAEGLADVLPAGWDFSRPMLRGPLTLGLMASGAPAALAVTAASELSDARVQVNGTLDLPGRHWKGPISLHHPGANRLLTSLGLGSIGAWLGDGSLSLQAVADGTPDRLSLAGVELSAGLLRTAGEVAVTGLGGDRPIVTGRVDADTLPLPAFDPRSNEPWALGLLQAADARLTLRAAHLLWGASQLADDASATVSLSGGKLRADAIAARLAGGGMTGQWSLEDSSPPRVAFGGTVTNIALNGPLAGTGVDVIAGRVDGSVDVSGAGYSPAAVLATIAGPIRLTIRDGAMSGLDAGRVLTVLRTAAVDAAAVQAGVADALRSGATPFTRMELEAVLSHGTATLGRGDITLPAGSIAVTGSLDVPEDAIDARLALRPALETAPVVGLRLIGPVAAPSRLPELADLARWLVDR